MQRKLARTYDRLSRAAARSLRSCRSTSRPRRPASTTRFSRQSTREFGRLDGLAHVAGILGDLSPIDQYDVPTWCKVLHVNLTATFILTRTLLPLLRRSEDAIDRVHVERRCRAPRAYWGAYAVSKFGTEGLMQVLADEMRDTTRIRVNSVNPGPTRTAMRARLSRRGCRAACSSPRP